MSHGGASHRSRRAAAARAVSATIAAALPIACDQHLGSGGDSATPRDAPWFEEVARERGLRFDHDSGHRERFLMPEIMSGGAALVDVDGDGDLDAYLVQSGSLLDPPERRPPNRLFRNDGNGRFEDVTEGSGADDRGYGMGVAAGDYDNDGDTDLYVTNVGPNALLRNEGGGRFTPTTEEARVGDPGFGSSAAFVDYDRDGDLDLFVLNYLDWSIATEIVCGSPDVPDYCSPQAYDAPARDVLYRNEGDGTFREVTRAAGLHGAPGTGLGVACEDFDGDGWVDLFVANDGMWDQLWINQGDGSFRDEALYAGCAADLSGVPKAGMGVTTADIDDDGDPDLLVCNLRNETDSMFINEGGTFRDTTAVSGLGAVSRPFTRFGMAWIDFDNDGVLDLFQANGRVTRQAERYSDDPFAEPNLLFRGRPGPSFIEVTPRGGTATLLVGTSRAAAFGDVDADGGVDILVVNRDGPAELLRNSVEERGHWTAFRVVDESGRDALGARVALSVGGRRLTRTVKSAYSYLAANDPRVHFGLGASTRAGEVVVTWPDGAREAFGDHAADGVVTLRRGEGDSARPGTRGGG